MITDKMTEGMRDDVQKGGREREEEERGEEEGNNERQGINMDTQGTGM